MCVRGGVYKDSDIDINYVLLETDITLVCLFLLQHQCLAGRWRVICIVLLD